MRAKLSYILLTLGFVSLSAQLIYRGQRDKDFLASQIELQKEATEVGLKEKWKNHVLQAMQSGQIQKGYRLTFDRLGLSPINSFFPFVSANLNWAEYRYLKAKNETENIKTFLKKAINTPKSWDRVLALEEWYKVFQETTEPLDPYEQTLFSAEAKKAYEFIFSQFDGKIEYPLVRDEWQLDKVLFHLNKNGEIETFVPSTESLRLTILPDFLKKERVESAELALNPFDISNIKLVQVDQNLLYVEWIWVTLSLMLLLGGIIFYMGTLNEERSQLIRRVTFLNQLVHEIKTPLTGLKLHTELMLKGTAAPENLTALKTGVDNLNQVFDEIVAVNRPMEKAKLTKLTPQETLQIIYELKAEFDKINIDGQPALEIFTEKGRLKLILKNLFKNAIRYGQECEVKFTTVGSSLKIFVSDKGPGVSFADAKKIFNEFYRSDKARSTNSDGLGVGLSIVKKLALEISADVKLENPGQKGAVFSITLRRAE